MAIKKNSSYNLNIDGYCVEHLYGNKFPQSKKVRHSGGISNYYKDSYIIISKLCISIVLSILKILMYNYGNCGPIHALRYFN